MNLMEGQSILAPLFLPGEGSGRIRVLQLIPSKYGKIGAEEYGRCPVCHVRTNGEAISAPLFLGKLENEIKAKVCRACWKKWEAMRVMVINEYQVNLGEESGRELVRKQMKAFLKLGEQADTSKVAENYRPAKQLRIIRTSHNTGLALTDSPVMSPASLTLRF